jgi:membrane protein YdbS with pleckstrin-like domain
VSQDPFQPPGENWTRVSPRLVTLRRTLLLIVALPVGAAAVAVVTLAGTLPGLLAAVVVAAAVAWAWVVVGRAARSWRYAERAEDLLVARGVLRRQLVVVPYGRMQFVDVTAGPLDRRFGLAAVQLHTAAAATDARIPGLPPEEAARLRDRLAALGEARSAGL